MKKIIAFSIFMVFSLGAADISAQNLGDYDGIMSQSLSRKKL